MQFSERIMKVWETDGDKRRDFSNFLEKKIGHFAKARLFLLIDILKYKNIVHNVHLACAHILFQKFLSEDVEERAFNPVEPDDMKKHVKAIHEKLFQNEEGLDEKGLVNDKLFDPLLADWLLTDVERWWDRFEKNIQETEKPKKPERVRRDSIFEPTVPPDSKQTKSDSSQDSPKSKKISGLLHFTSRANSSDQLLPPGQLTPPGKRKSKMGSPNLPKKKISANVLAKKLSIEDGKVSNKPSSFFSPIEQSLSDPIEEWTNETVCRWLEFVDMPEYIETFRKQGITGLALSTMKPDFLVAINISEVDAESIVFLVTKRPSGSTIRDWNVQDVVSWLIAIKHGEYRRKFVDQRIRGEDLLDNFSEEELAEMGVSPGHFASILTNIEYAKALENSIKA